jgi:hypothetical protein
MASSTSSGLPVNDIVRTRTKFEEHGIGGSFLGKYYTRLLIGPYQRPKPFDQTRFKPKYSVFLPLPTDLRDLTRVDYNTPNLETVGDFVNGADGATRAAVLRTSGDIISGTGQLGARVLGGAAEAAPGAAGKILGAVTGAATNYINQLFQADQMTSAIQQSAGIAPNPNPSVAFQGPVLREVSYRWGFFPKNREESLAIQRLIKVLKQSALPSSALADSAAILQYPDICQINFYPWDKTGDPSRWGWSEDSILRYKKMVMTNVNVSYNAFGVPSFFEGTNLPTSYELSIDFKEIEYMLRDDWADADVAEFRITRSDADFDSAFLSTAGNVGSGAVTTPLMAGVYGVGAAAALTTGGAFKILREGKQRVQEKINKEKLSGVV